MFDEFTILELLRCFIQHVLQQMTEGMKVEDSTGSLEAAMSMLSRAMLNEAFVSSDGCHILLIDQ